MKSIERRDFLKGTATGVFAFTVGGVEVVLSAREARAQNVPFRLLKGPGVRENPAAAVGTRIATSASVRTEKRTVDRRILVDDDWRRVGQVGAPFSSLFSLGGL
jgi:hypothetical protein